MRISIRSIVRPTMLVVVVTSLTGCFATQQDIQVLQGDLRLIRSESATADSLRMVQLDAVLRSLRSVNDSMTAVTNRMTRFRADMTGNLSSINEQLFTIQELTGQSQRRLQEMRAQLEERQQAQSQALFEAPPPSTRQVPVKGAPTKPTPPANTAEDDAPPARQLPPPPAEAPGPNQLFQIAREQLMQGSYSTARSAFQDLLNQYPKSDLAGEAQFFVAETYAAEGESAAADSVYARVGTQYPKSPRASTALYKRAVLAETAGKTKQAVRLFNEVMTKFPRSDEASLAIDRVRALETE